jgi:hypothetical protein
MDPFTHMAQVLASAKSEHVEPPKALEAKKARKPSDTKKYVTILVRMYGINMSSLTYWVVESLLEGNTPQQVADSLDLNRNAVYLHKANLAKKLGVSIAELFDYIRKWKEQNPQAQVAKPEVESVSIYLVDGVVLTKFRYELLKDLLTKDVDTVAKERGMSKDSVRSNRHHISESLGLAWDKLAPKVQRFWVDNPPVV